MLKEKIELGLYESDWRILIAILPSKDEAKEGVDLVKARIRWQISERLREAKQERSKQMEHDYRNLVFLRKELSLPLDEWERVRDALPIGAIAREKINEFLELHNEKSPCMVLRDAVLRHFGTARFKTTDAEWIIADLKRQGWELRKIDDTES